MGENEPKPSTGENLDYAKLVTRLGGTGTRLANSNAKIDDEGEISADSSIEHRVDVDKILEGATVSVVAAKGHVLEIYSGKSGGPVRDLRSNIPFTGTRLSKDIPAAELRVKMDGPGCYVSLDADNSEGEYIIIHVEPPKSNG